MNVKLKITKEQFCKLISAKQDSWIFNGVGKCDYWIGRDDRIYFDNGADTIWQFMDDQQHGKILYSHAGRDEGSSWSAWETWYNYDKM